MLSDDKRVEASVLLARFGELGPTAQQRLLDGTHLNEAGDLVVMQAGQLMPLLEAARALRDRRRRQQEAETIAARGAPMVSTADPTALWLALPQMTRALFELAARTDDDAERELFLKIGRAMRWQTTQGGKPSVAVLALNLKELT